MKIFALKPAQFEEYGPKIQKLEMMATYPYGNDRFQIDHGENYFQFFKRLGNTHYWIAEKDGEVAAVSSAVLRRVALLESKKSKKCWYLCDLKVAPQYRGENIPLKIFNRALVQSYIKCGRGYFVSMNEENTPNRMARLINHNRFLPFSSAPLVEFFTFPFEEAKTLEPLLKSELGPVGYRSNAGIKDLVMQSTGTSLPLLHLQHGPTSDITHPQATPGFTHMLCCLETSQLSLKLKARNLYPSATGTIVHHRMSRSDFKFILTSDI